MYSFSCAALPVGERALTIHSSRSRFAARLNSGVIRCWVVIAVGHSFGNTHSSFTVGSGQRPSALLLPTVSGFGLDRTDLGASIIRSFGHTTHQGVRVERRPASWYRIGPPGSSERFGQICQHRRQPRITTHSTRSRFAARVTLSVRRCSGSNRNGKARAPLL
jgi:hypothetical protein